MYTHNTNSDNVTFFPCLKQLFQLFCVCSCFLIKPDFVPISHAYYTLIVCVCDKRGLIEIFVPTFSSYCLLVERFVFVYVCMCGLILLYACNDVFVVWHSVGMCMILCGGQ